MTEDHDKDGPVRGPSPELKAQIARRRAAAALRPPVTVEKAKSQVEAHLRSAREIMTRGPKGTVKK